MKAVLESKSFSYLIVIKIEEQSEIRHRGSN